MRRNFTPERNSKFEGTRYYHRAGSYRERSWDEWVDGVPAKQKRLQHWLRILGIVMAILALAGIVAGLYYQLR
jgi:hypothetical protein